MLLAVGGNRHTQGAPEEETGTPYTSLAASFTANVASFNSVGCRSVPPLFFLCKTEPIRAKKGAQSSLSARIRELRMSAKDVSHKYGVSFSRVSEQMQRHGVTDLW